MYAPNGGNNINTDAMGKIGHCNHCNGTYLPYLVKCAICSLDYDRTKGEQVMTAAIKPDAVSNTRTVNVSIVNFR